MTRSAVAGPLVLLILATTGCSLLFVHGPPDGYQEMESFSCTESRVLPILDMVGVGANIYGAATAEDDPGLFEEDGQLFALSREANIALGVASAAILVASSFVGFQRVNACRAALEELRQRSPDRPSRTPDARLPVLRPTRF